MTLHRKTLRQLEILRRALEAAAGIALAGLFGTAFVALLWIALGACAGLLQFLRYT